MAYYGEIIKGIEKEEPAEYKVNSEEYKFPKVFNRELEYQLNYKIEEMTKITGKDYYYIVIKVKR